jgi:hypothetical protein
LVELAADGAVTFGRLPGLTMGLSHYTTHTFGYCQLVSCCAERNVTLFGKTQDLFEGTMAKAAMPVEELQLACCKQFALTSYLAISHTELYVNSSVPVDRKLFLGNLAILEGFQTCFLFLMVHVGCEETTISRGDCLGQELIGFMSH